MTEPGVNYFILLDLDAAAPWDEEVFRKTLNAKQKQWTRESMGIDFEAQVARRNIDLIDDIRRVMSDKQLRAQHIQPINTMQGERQQQRLIEFEQRLAQRERKGYLEEHELQELALAFQDVVTENEIIAQINVPMSTNQVREKEVEHLEPGILWDIAEKLAFIQVKNLYALLSQSHAAPSDLLSRLAEQLYNEQLQHQPKTTEGEIRQMLAGHAKNIFSSPQRRQEYDSALIKASQTETQQASESKPISSRTTIEIPTRPASHIPAERKEIEQLKLQNLGKALRISWLWPADCYEVVVTYSEQDWPRPEQGMGKTIKVTRAFYEEGGGHFDLHVAVNQQYYIVVSPVRYQTSRVSIESGVRIQGYLQSQATINYEIRNPRLGYKDRTLHLFIEPPARIPTLLLISKRNGLPLHNADGELLHKVEGPLVISQRETVIKLPDSVFPANTFARLFLEDKKLVPFVPILTPAEKKLRLGK